MEQQPTVSPIVEDLKAAIEKHRAELEEEIERDRSVFDLLGEDGRTVIKTEDHANLAASAIMRAMEELDRIQEIARQRIARAERRVQSLEFLFRGALELWTKAAVAGRKHKSILLEDAKLQVRTVPAKTETESEAALKAWAERFLPEAVEYEPKILTSIVKAWEEKEGKLAPGRHAVDSEERFYIYGKSAKGEQHGEAR